MNISERGTIYRYGANGFQVEEVCTCDCHDRPGVIHFMKCCGIPTEAGKLLLEEFEKNKP